MFSFFLFHFAWKREKKKQKKSELMVEVASSLTSLVATLASDSVRLDGRGFNDPRVPAISFPAGPGFVEATLGETKVTCHAVAKLIPPKGSPNKGSIKINVFNCSGNREISSPRLGDVLQEIFRESGCVNLEALCIKPEEAIWSIKCTICVLNDDGGLEYASCLAVSAALMHVDILVTELTPDGEVLVYGPDERIPTNIQLAFIPVCFTGVIVDRKDPDPNKPVLHYLLVDPTCVEMSISKTVTFVSCSHLGVPIKMEKIGHDGGIGDLTALLHTTKAKASRLGGVLIMAAQTDVSRRRTSAKQELENTIGTGKNEKI